MNQDTELASGQDDPDGSGAVDPDGPPCTDDPSARDGSTVDPTAVMGRRIGAWLIDAAIGGTIFAAYFAYHTLSQFEVVQFASYEGANDHCDRISTSAVSCVASDNSVWISEAFEINETSLVVAWLIPVLILTMLLPGITGWSIGKLATGLRVVDSGTLEHAGFWRNVARGLLWVVDAFPWVFPLVGLIVGSRSKAHRRVGDMAAGTLVIRKQDTGLPLPR